MADTTFVDNVLTTANRIVAAWLNAIGGAIYRGENPIYAVTTGSANAYVFTIPATSLKTGLTAGDKFYGKANFTNTGAATLTIVGASTFTAAAIQLNAAALIAGEIRSGCPLCVQWDGVAFQLIGPFAGTESSFTGTLTGVTATVTGTIRYTKVDNQVTLQVPAFTGTSNTTAKTITGMPAAIAPPTGGVTAVARMSDNGGATALGVVVIDTGPVINLYPTGAAGNWTGSGTMASSIFQVTYLL